VQFINNGAGLRLTYGAFALGNYSLSINAPAVKDRAGNALGATPTTSSFIVRAATAVWANVGGGFWDVPANWESGVVPGPADDVLISMPGNVPITFRTGNAAIRSLATDNPLVLSGGILNVAETVQLNNSFAVSGGTLVNARIVSGAVAQTFTTSGSATFDGVKLGVDLTVANNATLQVKNGLTLNNAKVRLAGVGNATTLDFYLGAQTLGGTGEVIFDGNGNNYLYAQGDNTQSGAATLTIGAGITVRGPRGGLIQGYYSYDRIINQGAINADSAGYGITLTRVTNEGTITAGPGNISMTGESFTNAATRTITVTGATLTSSNTTSFTNQGTLSILNTGKLSLLGLWTNPGTITANTSTLTLGSGTTTWNNTGTLAANNSTVNFGGLFTVANVGTFNRTGGAVNVTGILNNTGTTLTLNGTTGSWNVGSGGTIRRGTISATGGASLTVPVSNSATLEGVTLAAGLTVANNATLLVRNGLTLNNAKLTIEGTGNSTSVIFSLGAQTLGGTGEVIFGGNGNNYLYAQGNNTSTGPATLTIGSTISIRGPRGGVIQGYYANDRVINQGAIIADATGHTITVSQITNQGTLYASGGALNVSALATNAGVLRAGIGRVISIVGNFTNGVTGTVHIDFSGSGASEFGRLSVSGATTLAGTLNLNLINGYSPAQGDSFGVISFGSRSGQFTTINGAVIGDGNQFAPAYSATGLTLNVVAAAAAPANLAIVDRDGDGSTDIQEAVFGTDPLDPTSSLRFNGIRVVGADVVLEVATVAGRTYTIECCTDLVGGKWTPISENVPGTGRTLVFSDDGARARMPRCFYRIRVGSQ